MDLKPGKNVLGTPLLTPADVGEHLRLSEKTLANWRCQGRGPAFLRVGRDIRYRPEDVLAWLEGEQIPHGEAPTDRKAG
ncbi:MULTISPECIES: helix-turn-helix domain-containing protein [unclassified Aeromicrobium]|uniref:helix-turn-helix domain-containing protein n=1 Tax=unclassified Aeromicrobium TaxID=2633570 RepID=UPI0028893C8D|nr:MULTISPECIES: helix-turn-helix domain-containing protein [unclassified Aeromicrobium]